MVRRGLGRPSRSFDATAASAEKVLRQKMQPEWSSLLL
jgi:hypothetical protein